MKTVYDHGQPLRLAADALIQAGGEGTVFACRDRALKVYHDPNPGHEAKLRAWARVKRQVMLPATIVAPSGALTDAHGNVIGMAMPLLPDGAVPMRRLAQRHYCQQYSVSLHEVMLFLADAATTLSALHRAGIVVGDLNDRNLHFVRKPRPRVYWIDTDSYQLDDLPCPVASQGFLDPRLYGVADFTRQPAFDPESDRYAFAVLVAQSILQVHPFGGVHHQYKTIPARVKAGITVSDPTVTYPANARPAGALPPELRSYMERTFSGERAPLLADRLNQLARQLVTCPTCGTQMWPGAECGSCRQRRRASGRPVAVADGAPRLLLEGQGTIVALDVDRVTGRCRVITFANHTQYSLHEIGPAGAVASAPLFSGQPGYRFFFFGDCVAVHAPPGPVAHEDHPLLLLRLGGGGPRKLGLTSAGAYRHRPVTAGAGATLVRLAGGYLLRGGVQQGHFTEKVVADARKNQTRIWSRPLSEDLIGFYRIFDRFEAFLLTGNDRFYPLALPPAPGAARVTDVRPIFGRRQMGFVRMLAGGGVSEWDVVMMDAHGVVSGGFGGPAGMPPPYNAVIRHNGLLLAGEGELLHITAQRSQREPCPETAAGDRLLPHPQGWLLWQPERLYLLHYSL